MALTLTRAVSMKFQLVGKQLRDASHSWFRRARPRPAAAVEAETPAHTFNHLHKNGEMNHMGHYHCDSCSAEMRLAPAPVSAEDAAGTKPRFQWECSGCGSLDDTSFRICRCGRQTVLEKHAASARELPVSLNAGGCTECERCVVCDGILAVGNLKWFYGRWTHLYPATEYDRRTDQQYTVTRERSKFYGFHCHFSCYDKDPKAVERLLDGRAPDWYKQGVAEQQRTETKRLRRQRRCLVCRGRLGFWDRIYDRETHSKCH